MTVLDPSVAITSPADAATLEATSLALSLDVSDFTMSGDVGGAAVIGEGHFHVFVDGAYYNYGTDPSRFIVTGLTPGPHTITAELVHSDHASLSPAIRSTINVNVASDARTITLDDSMFGAVDSASVYVPVSVANFTLAPDDVDGTASEGEGHYHVYVNGSYVTYGAGAGVWLHHLPAGTHTVEVRAADNDHTEIEGVDSGTLVIAEGRPDVRITSPADGEILSGDGFNVMVDVENFTFAPDEVGSSTNADGTGHYHVYVDGIYYNYDTSASTLILGMDPGDHTVQLELVNNDHSSFTYPVMTEAVTVTIE